MFDSSKEFAGTEQNGTNLAIANLIEASTQACNMFERNLENISKRINEIDAEKKRRIESIRKEAEDKIKATHVDYSQEYYNLIERQNTLIKDLNRVAQNRAAFKGENWTAIIPRLAVKKHKRIDVKLLSEVVVKIISSNPSYSRNDILLEIESDIRFAMGKNLPATLARVLKKMNHDNKIELVNGSYRLEKTKRKSNKAKSSSPRYDSTLIQERVNSILGKEALTVAEVQEKLKDQGYNLGQDSRRVRGILLGMSRRTLNRSVNSDGREVYSL